MKGICRLCKKDTELRNSHILPEFLYSKLYDDKHRTMSISYDEKEKYIQKGVREYLLCQECETKFSRYEGYAVKVITDIPNFLEHSSGRFVFQNNVNYALFKLFQLSILWRGGISTNKMFVNVNLHKHEERIREMLEKEEPGAFTDYGSFIIRMLNPQKLDRIIMPAMPERLYGHNGFRFMTGDLFWYFIVSSHKVGNSVQPLLFQEDGQLRIWNAPWNEHAVLNTISELFRTRKVK